MAAFAWLLAALYLQSNISHVAAESTISTFSDTDCQKSLQSLPGKDGFPDGLCLQLRQQASAQYGSFMIVDLDYGCAVTLYGTNVGSDPCSSETKIIGSIAVCYNTSWLYWSVDNCVKPSLIPTTTAVTPIETSSTAAATQTSGGGGGGTNVGAIVGGVIGGVAFLAMVAAGALFFLWLQPKKKKKAAAAAAAAGGAAPTDRDEEDQKDKPPMEEVPGHHHQPQELSSHYVSEVPSNHYKDGGQHELPTPVPVELPDRQY